MAELKSVYFAPDGKWFETRTACESYEAKQALITVIVATGINEDAAKKAAKAILTTYDMYAKAAVDIKPEV